jgi:ABC-type Fe2+-enterobactin transport system substrate-binding protein
MLATQEKRFRMQAIDPNKPDVIVAGAVGQDGGVLAWNMIQLQKQFPNLVYTLRDDSGKVIENAEVARMAERHQQLLIEMAGKPCMQFA